jgi:hypothetical protein
MDGLWFLAGLWLGGVIGFSVHAIVAASKQGDPS